MKTRNAMLNVIFNAVVQIINIFLMLALRRIFSSVLGDDILGVNSIYSSITSFLALSELGIGVTITACLYKPLAEGNSEKIAGYMNFLRKIYTWIGIFILVAGTGLIPFLHLVIKEDFDQLFLAISFELYVFSTAITYFISYKKVMLGADQKSYMLSVSQMIYKIVLGMGQLVVLTITRNYFYYLFVAIICNFSENLIISKICNKLYPYINKKVQPISISEKQEVGNKVVGMLCYKIANYMIQGTDNVIISMFLGTAMVAYYNNYLLVVNMLYAVFACISVSSQAGLGNIVYSNRKRLEFAFSKLLLIQQYATSFSAAAFFVLSTFFVKSIFTTSKIFDIGIVGLMVAIYYIRGYSEAIESIRASVAEYSDKYVNILIAFLNVFLSIIFIKQLGVGSVLLGTLACYILKEFVIVPCLVFRKLLKGGIRKYFVKTLINIILTMFIICLLCGMTLIYPINSWIRWSIYGVLAFVISFGMNTLVYCKTEEYMELKWYVIATVRRIINKS